MSAKRAQKSAVAADAKVAAIERQLKKLENADPNKPDTAWTRAGGTWACHPQAPKEQQGDPLKCTWADARQWAWAPCWCWVFGKNAQSAMEGSRYVCSTCYCLGWVCLGAPAVLLAAGQRSRLQRLAGLEVDETMLRAVFWTNVAKHALCPVCAVMEEARVFAESRKMAAEAEEEREAMAEGAEGDGKPPDEQSMVKT